MSMHWKPEVTKPVALGKSRIRRDPVPLASPVALRKVPPRSDTKETWFGVAGVLVIAATLVIATVGIAVATYSKFDPSVAAEASRFGQCYNGGPNCVLSGDTIYVGSARVEIAGMEAPGIQGARCEAERTRGIEAAVQLANLLNSGRVTVSGTFRDEFGRDVRKVQVKGVDVAGTLISAELAREYGSKTRPWC